MTTVVTAPGETPPVAETGPDGGGGGLTRYDLGLLCLLLPLWMALFLVGTLVASAPYRASFATFEGGVAGSLRSGLVVLSAYTLSNVALLCMIASVLGAIGAKARLEPDVPQRREGEPDVTSPRTSAILRGFMVYLTLVSGVIVFAEAPSEPTQSQYVKMAGVLSLVAFIVSYRPALFAGLLDRGSTLLSEPKK